MDYLYIGILIVQLSLYSTLNGLHVRLHAISRCVDDTCESGVGIYPHCTDCKKFIYCIFGYAVERTCPENLVFDITYGICNFPRNGKCWNNLSLNPGRIGIERTFNKPLRNIDTNFLLNKDGLAMKNIDLDVTLKTDDSTEKGDLKTNAPPAKVSLNTDDPPEEVSLNTDDPPEVATMKTDDPPEKVTTNDPPGDMTMQTDDPPEKVSLNTDDPPDEVTMKTDDLQKEAILNTDDPPEKVTLNTDDPPEEVTMKTDDLQEEVTLNTEDPPEKVTLNTDDPPEEVTMKTDDIQEEVTLNTDDRPEKVTLNTDDPPEKVTLNTDDPPEKVTLNTDDPPEKVTMKSDTKQVTKIAEPINNLKEQQTEDTMNTDDPPEEWNREYSINPDFPQNIDPAESNTASYRVDKKPMKSSDDVPEIQVPCVKDCNGMPEGNYQSCDGCTRYVSCMWGMKLDNTCLSGLHWDDISKKCLTHSITC